MFFFLRVAPSASDEPIESLSDQRSPHPTGPDVLGHAVAEVGKLSVHGSGLSIMHLGAK